MKACTMVGMNVMVVVKAPRHDLPQNRSPPPLPPPHPHLSQLSRRVIYLCGYRFGPPAPPPPPPPSQVTGRCLSVTQTHRRLQLDEIFKICNVLGSFTPQTWPEGDQLLKEMGFALVAVPERPLSHFVPLASPCALDLMASLCLWDPSKRPTASQALKHPFFEVCVKPPGPCSSATPCPGCVPDRCCAWWRGDTMLRPLCLLVIPPPTPNPHAPVFP